jgi:hypothetical protein
MNLRKIVKQTLNEVAGISFEVREWAQILSNEIDRQVEEADKAEAAKSETTEEPKETVPSQHATEYDEVEEGDFISHFEDLSGQAHDDAWIEGDDLIYQNETVVDFPEITNLIKGKTIKISIESEYEMDGLKVDVEGAFDSKYEEVLEDMVFDHADWGQPFYDYNTHNELMAVFDGDLNDVETGEVNGNTWSSGTSSWGSGWGSSWGSNWKPTPRADIKELVINGKDYPEAYKKFSVDKWIFRQASRIEYSHYESGYNEETGDYEVIFNVPLRGLSMGMFVHETKHAYDDWNRMRHGGKPIRDSWEIKNIYTKDFENLILGGSAKYPRLGHIIRMYYLGSKLETPAYLENEYDSPALKSYRDTGVKLRDFKINNFTNKRGKPIKGLQDEFVDILINYDIPFFRKFKDVMDFLRYTKKYFNKRGRDIVKRIDKTLYVHGKVTDSTPPRKWTPPKRPKGPQGPSNHGTQGTLF